MPVEYAVTCYPDEDVNRDMFTVHVAYRGAGRWAVLWRGFCWDKTNRQWSVEHIPSERRDDWLADHRYGNAVDALAVARKLAPDLDVMGWKWQDTLAYARSVRERSTR